MRRTFLLLVMVLSCIAGYSNAAIRRAFLEEGPIEGMDKGAVTAFLGIPFAVPPLSELRWAPPQDAAWRGPRTADHYSSSCMQRDQTGGFGPWTPEYIIPGFTNDEGSASPNYGKATRKEFEKEARRRCGDLADEFLELYPVTDDTMAGEIAKEAARDRTRVGTYDWARRRVADGRGPTFIYIWGHAEPGHNAEHYGAFHSSEVPYVFDNLGNADRPYTEEDHRIATIMATYWANFVKTGDPNGKGVPDWPSTELRKPEIMELGTTFESEPVTDATRLRFFEKYLETPEVKAKGWSF